MDYEWSWASVKLLALKAGKKNIEPMDSLLRSRGGLLIVYCSEEIFSYTVDCSAGSVEVSKLKLKVDHLTRMIHILPFPSFPAFSFSPSAGRGLVFLVKALGNL